MSLYRCAACGSPNVVTDTQKEGYNYVKGAIGTVLLGVGGAAAGINGKKQEVFKCPDCGLTLNYSMDFEIKTLIDLGVMSEYARNNLTLRGVKIDWAILTAKYRNIETNLAPAPQAVTPQVNEAPKTTSTDSVSTLSEEELFDNQLKYIAAKREYDKIREQWEDAVLEISDLRDKETEEQTQAFKAQKIASIESQKKSSISKHTQAIESLRQRQSAVEEHLAQLGFFKFSEKSKAKKELSDIAFNLEEEKSLLNSAETNYKNNMAEVDNIVKKQRTVISDTVRKQHPMPMCPDKPKDLQNFKENGEKTPALERVMNGMQDAMFKYMVESDKAFTISELMKSCPVCADLTHQTIAQLLSSLVSEEKVRESTESGIKKYTAKFFWIPAWVNARGRRAGKKFISEHEEECKAILDVLANSPSPLQINDIRSQLPQFADYSSSKFVVFLHKMKEASLVTRIEINGGAHFSIKIQ